MPTPYSTADLLTIGGACGLVVVILAAAGLAVTYWATASSRHRIADLEADVRRLTPRVADLEASARRPRHHKVVVAHHGQHLTADTTRSDIPRSDIPINPGMRP